MEECREVVEQTETRMSTLRNATGSENMPEIRQDDDCLVFHAQLGDEKLLVGELVEQAAGSGRDRHL